MPGHDDPSAPKRRSRSEGSPARESDDTRTSAAPDGESRPRPSRLDWPTILRNIALALVLLAGVWAVFNVRLPSIDVIQDDIAAAGFWGFAVFILIYLVVAATPIPVTIMAVAGGLIFGLPFGTLLSMIGVVAGCWGGYWIARGLGRDTVMRLLGSHAESIESRLTGGGFYAVCALRLMPGFPYWPVNYGSGALGIDNRTFLIATIVSALPGQLSLVAVGAFIGNPTVLNGIAVAISWALVIVLTIFTVRRWKRTRDTEAGSGSEAPKSQQSAESD
ncbi:TVP38/TMEM64 family protein [Brevibacterium spongiae]|uniref:TVP38/TMEM64 family membrane protein n=1 Tax=Brevibacterium spongiae TaxID=2909672 RepID=A0ABY5SNX0_9MICO|nr:TVP38/TMEM64 family protein [Brevibacterium spongiae]UVI36255.1 TVP38/TMEM64 family protein [Brevibacterium spongiae]